MQFIQSNKHQGATFAGSGGRFDQQVLFAAFLVGAFLHGAHPQGVGLGGSAILGVGNGNSRNGDRVAHRYFSARVKTLPFDLTQ